MKGEQLLNELVKLCAHYKIPDNKRPKLDIFESGDFGENIGIYCNFTNTVWVQQGLDSEEAIKTVRHEFGHFLLDYRDPEHKYHKGEERICRMMERTLLRFPHLVKSTQKPLELFI